MKSVKKTPKVGDLRIRRIFLFKSRNLRRFEGGMEKRWLEFADVIQEWQEWTEWEYTPEGGETGYYSGWKDIGWWDEERNL
jgi:hypothetical protein